MHRDVCADYNSSSIVNQESRGKGVQVGGVGQEKKLLEE